MKKEIIIINNNMEIGGIQKSLLNLINNVCDEYNITLFLFYPSGKLINEIDRRVKIISAGRLTRIMGMSQADAKANGILTYAWRTLWAVITRAFGRRLTYTVLPRLQRVRNSYDVAISYMQNAENNLFYGGCNEFVLRSVKAKKKVAFIHNDFINYPGNLPYNNGLYKEFDAVACVSDSVKETFCTVCPECRDKSVRVYNMHNYEYMQAASEEFLPEFEDGFINIFTAARISEEKGILRMIKIFSDLKQDNSAFRWYVAGDGKLFGEAKRLIEYYGMEKNIILLGMKSNPYPYFRYADMVLVPSYNEAAPMVFGEAGFFGTPVLTTDTTSAYELVGDVGGWVVKNDDDAIKEKLKELLLGDKSAFNKLVGYTASNSVAVADFHKLINN